MIQVFLAIRGFPLFLFYEQSTANTKTTHLYKCYMQGKPVSGSSRICQQILYGRCRTSLHFVFPVPRFPGTLSTRSSGKILLKVSFLSFFCMSFFLSLSPSSFSLSFSLSLSLFQSHSLKMNNKTLMIMNETRASSIGPKMNHFYRLLVEDSKRRESLYRYLNSREAKEIENVYSKSR